MFRNMLNDQSSVQIYDPLAPSRYFSTKYPTIRMICQSRPISHFSNNCIFYSLPPDIWGKFTISAVNKYCVATFFIITQFVS